MSQVPCISTPVWPVIVPKNIPLERYFQSKPTVPVQLQMADFNPFGEFTNLDGSFGNPSEFNAFPDFEAAGFDQGTIPREQNTHRGPDALLAPNLPYPSDFLYPQAGHFDMFRGGEEVQDGTIDGTYRAEFADFADILQDDEFWKNVELESSLNHCEPDQSTLQMRKSKEAPKSKDFWDLSPTSGSAPHADLSAQSPLFDSTQVAMSPPAVPLNTRPVVDSSGVTQCNYFQQQGEAPIALMHQQPARTDYWPPTPYSVYREPEAVASPTMNKRKRKAADSDESDDESHTLPTEKRRKPNQGARKLAVHDKVPRNVVVTQRLNTRTKNIMKFNASEVYDPLPRPPANWSIFKYTSNGELVTGSLYTPTQIHHYLYKHPLHTLPNGTYSPKTGGLRLWIQRNPADSRRRYPVDGQSNRCRFTNCLATHNVINQGHLRLCFDEISHLNTQDFHADPFHNAGYIHLNCLERHLDFPQLCHDLPILIDDRFLSLEPDSRNKMTPPGQNAPQIARSFIEACEQQTLTDYPKGARPHAGTLVERLMSHKVEARHGFNYRQVEARGGVRGSHGLKHLGDLEVEMRTRDLTRRPRYQNQGWGPKTKKALRGRARKGWADSEDEDEESNESESE